MTVPQAVLDEIALIREDAYPLEACGVVTGDGRVIEIGNISPDPCRAYVMNPEQQVKVWQDEADLVAIWHTHPEGSSDPSGGDIAYAVYPELIYIIAGTDGVRGWEIRDGQADAVL